MKLPTRNPNLLVLGLLIILRFITVMVTWITARQSYIFDISVDITNDIIGTPPFLFGLLFLLFKFIAAVVIEIFYSTDFTDQQLDTIPKPTLRRLQLANFFLFIAELGMLINLLFELKTLNSINFVKNIITSGSLFGMLMNPSEYFLFWPSVICYLFGITVYLFPFKSDKNQTATDKGTIFLFLRSVVLTF